MHTGGMLFGVRSCTPEHSGARRSARPSTAPTGRRGILLARPAHLPPTPTPTAAAPALASHQPGLQRRWAQGAAGSTHLQSRPELEGLSVPRALLHHVHLGLDALLGIERDPVPLPVIHLHGNSQGESRGQRDTSKLKGEAPLQRRVWKGWEPMGQHRASWTWGTSPGQSNRARSEGL